MRTDKQQPRRGLGALFHRHQPIFLAVIAGIAVFVFLTSRTFNPDNRLIRWYLAAVVYIGLTWYRMLTSDVHRIRKRSAELDFSDVVLLVLSIGAALASIAGIGLELHGIKDAAPDAVVARACGAIVTIFVSWTFLHAVHDPLCALILQGFRRWRGVEVRRAGERAHLLGFSLFFLHHRRCGPDRRHWRFHGRHAQAGVAARHIVVPIQYDDPGPGDKRGGELAVARPIA